MPRIFYYRLPKEITHDALLERVQKLRELRLLSLQTDPTSFVSRYQDEVDQPIEFWLARQTYPLVEHFVAVETNQPDAAALEIDATAGRFVAFLVVSKSDDEQRQDSEQFSSSNLEANHMESLGATHKFKFEAVYVEPAYRGRGICTRLIQKATDWIDQETRKAKKNTAMVLLTVAEGNGSATRLYSKLGFRPTSQTHIKDRAGVDRPVTSMEYVLDCSGTRLQ